MGKRTKRVQYHLDSGTVQNLSYDEIVAILRAADELIDRGGRTMLTKILKGSKDRKILELGMDQCPSYGYYHALKMEEIGNRVDWMIRQDYLRIRYDYRLPLIIFSERGWEIEKRTFAIERYNDFCKAARDNDETMIDMLKENTNRQVVLIVLNLISERGEPYMIPLLLKWKEVEVRKIRNGIEHRQNQQRMKRMRGASICAMI